MYMYIYINILVFRFGGLGRRLKRVLVGKEGMETKSKVASQYRCPVYLHDVYKYRYICISI